jgi:hypothetical protein
MLPGGALGTRYHAHVDTSRSLANTALVIGHIEDRDERVPDVVIDRIDVWRPKDFADGQIDYPAHRRRTCALRRGVPHRRAHLRRLPVCQFVDRLNAFTRGLPWRSAISIRQPTARSNCEEAEIFTTALAMDKIHCPEHELAEQELLFLG